MLNGQEDDFTASFLQVRKVNACTSPGSLWQSGELSRFLGYRTTGWTLTMFFFLPCISPKGDPIQTAGLRVTDEILSNS